MASQWRPAAPNLLLLCQSLQEGFEVPKWFQLPLQSSCHGLRYVAVNSLLLRCKLMLKVTQNTLTPTWTGNPQLASWACLLESLSLWVLVAAFLQSSCQGSLYEWPLSKSEVGDPPSKTGGPILARQRGEVDWLFWENSGWVTLWGKWGTSWEAKTKAGSLHKGNKLWTTQLFVISATFVDISSIFVYLDICAPS